MWKRLHALRNPEDGENGGGSGGATEPGSAGATPAPAQASTAAPAATAPAAPAPSGAAAPAPAAPKPEGGESKEPKAGYWPADWRESVSKEDAKTLTRLQRYASPEAALQALIAAQNRIAAGELKPTLGKNPTPEQIKEWREATGIPESSDKYDLGDLGKNIKPELLKVVLDEAHATNQTPDQVKATLKAWGNIERQIAQERTEADYNAQTAGEDVLQQEWGPEYRRNINLIHGMLDGAASPELKAKLLNGRLADGTPIGSSPEALKFLVGLALIQNPAGVVVPGNEANPLQGVEGEIEKIEKTMRENRQAYNKDEKMQARYRDLLEAREKLKPRQSA